MLYQKVTWNSVKGLELPVLAMPAQEGALSRHFDAISRLC